MAYGNYLAAVEWSEIVNVRSGSGTTITPHNIAFVSHLYAYATKDQRLRPCLGHILDKGEMLSPAFWHPLRVPIVHSPEAANSLATSLCTILDSLPTTPALDPDISEIVRVLEDATKSKRGVVSVLEPPADERRAQRVACPFNEPHKLPVPWGELTRNFKSLEHLLGRDSRRGR
jgi:hypothetical protein